MTQDQQRAAIEQYVRGYNNFDVEVMTANLHEDIVFINQEENNITQQTEGIEEFRTTALQARAFFSERTQKITDWQFNGDKVTIKVDFSGVLSSDYKTLNSGDALLLEGTTIFTFKEGKIARIEDKV